MTGVARIIKELDRGSHVFALLLVLAPVVWATMQGLSAGADTWDQVWYRPFYIAAGNSLAVLGGMLLVVFPLGLLLGCVAGLYQFPLKVSGMLVLAVPLLFPGFLISIGIQSLQVYLPYAEHLWVDGFKGCVWTGVVMTLPITTVGTWLAVRRLSQAERDVLRMRGGSWRLLWMALRRYAGTALGFSLLGGFLYLSDFGVSQIMGFPGISGDIQIAFASRYDFGLAAAKALVVLVAVAPVVWLASHWVVAAVFPDASAEASRQGEPQDPGFWTGALLGVLFFICCASGPGLAGLGLVRPLFRSGSARQLEIAGNHAWESLGVTLHYGLTGGVFAVVLALVIVLGLRKQPRWMSTAAALGLLLMALPSAVVALGVNKLSVEWPWADGVLRSQWVVGLGLGLRLAPLCAVVFLALLWVLPRSLKDVGYVTGMPAAFRKWRLDFPEICGAAMAMVIVAMILTLADVGAATLMQPPGSASFGSLLFASMDNSPEQMVAAMCAVYGLLPLAAGILLVLLWGGVSKFTK